MPSQEPRPPLFLRSAASRPAARPVSFLPGAQPREPAPALSEPAPEQVAADVEQARREALARVADALHTLTLEAERIAEQARGDAIEIGFQVASRILESEVRTNPEALFSLVKSALRKAGDSRRVVVRMFPADAALVDSDREGLGEQHLSAARVEVVPDPSLSPGDCVVETDFGQVDGRLATRLSEARRAVKAAVEGGVA
jgi:flagellar assembly protein FliH